jgi:hypothetical protein
MPLIWRGMTKDGNRPHVGRGAQLLGVRFGPLDQGRDIDPDREGVVHPEKGGMSVSPRVEALPPHRLPRRLRDVYPERFPNARAPNTLYCWSMGEGAFEAGRVAEGLRLRVDPDDPERHGFVEPDGKMKMAAYETALAATRDQWQKWEE